MPSTKLANPVNKLVDYEGSANCLSDDYSSLSGYESIESNYDTALSKKVEDMKAKFSEGKGSKTSFANPHYLCPDVQNIMETSSSSSKSATNKYGERMAR